MTESTHEAVLNFQLNIPTTEKRLTAKISKLTSLLNHWESSHIPFGRLNQSKKNITLHEFSSQQIHIPKKGEIKQNKWIASKNSHIPSRDFPFLAILALLGRFFFWEWLFRKIQKIAKKNYWLAKSISWHFFFRVVFFEKKKWKGKHIADKNNQNAKKKILRKILPGQEKKLASQDKILAVFFLSSDFFWIFLYPPWPTNLANFSWLFLAVFFFSRQERENPTGC